MKKYKILLISDHALSPSGVGTQSRFLVNGLLQKGCWTVRQLGAALKHDDYSLTRVTDDFLIKPVDGFGSPDAIRNILINEKPDVVLLFTDPRFFVWFWQIEDEVHQVCPIAYWHVWDNYPRPNFNDDFYESTDLINCHSYLSYNIVKEKWPERTNFIPHALPDDVFYKINDSKTKLAKSNFLGKEKENDFVLLWISRNAKRKRPADLLWAWKKFLDKIETNGERKPATFIMHTDPYDQEGPNLAAVADMLEISDSIVFSNQRVGFEEMNLLHNISDCSINLSYAEGFGLGTLEAMQAGNPIIAPKTGGLTRQVVDHRDGSENGVALDIEFQSLVGSQSVPFIYEDYVSTDTVANAIHKIYSLSPKERDELGKKCQEYVKSEFSYENTINAWHDSLLKLITDWKEGKTITSRFELREI